MTTNSTKQRDTHIGAIAIYDVNPEEITGGYSQVSEVIRIDLGTNILDAVAHLYIEGKNLDEQIHNLRSIANKLNAIANQAEDYALSV